MQDALDEATDLWGVKVRLFYEVLYNSIHKKRNNDNYVGG